MTPLDLAGGDVEQTEIAVTAARADVSSGEAASLSRGPEGWRLSAIGGNAPARADDPYACEAQG